MTRKELLQDLRTNTTPMGKKRLVKKGTIRPGAVESTPIVYDGKLLRFEWIRNWNAGQGYFHFIDMETELPYSEPFAPGQTFGCAYTENGTMYTFGSMDHDPQNVVTVSRSDDLKNWEYKTALTFPEDIRTYNTSCCKTPDGYLLTIEIGGKNPVVGTPFTCVFATSKDCWNWELLPMETYSYSTERYTACPSIRYYDGYIYMIYLEATKLHRFYPYIVRTKDLLFFEIAADNPVMTFGDEDKIIINPSRFSAEEIHYIENAINCNNSDLDFCDWNGKTIITYSWGNQLGKEFLALAEYDGTEKEFLQSFFND